MLTTKKNKTQHSKKSIYNGTIATETQWFSAENSPKRKDCNKKFLVWSQSLTKGNFKKIST